MADFIALISLSQEDPHNRMVERSSPKSIQVLNRFEYLNMASTALATSNSFYGAYHGPACFHPPWFFELQSKKEAQRVSPSPGSARMDEALGRLLTRPGGDERWVIFRNSPSYAEKLRAVTTDPQVLARLRVETTTRVRALVTAAPATVRIACFDIGHVRIPYIFDDCVITSRRQTAMEPVREAILSTDPGFRTFEAAGFRQLFLASAKPIEEEARLLVEFVDEATGSL